MKTIKLFSALIVGALISMNVLTAQTKQMTLHGHVNDYVFCLNKVLTGTLTYHVIYHVDKKTGVIDNIHWNILQANIVDSDGIRYKVIDTGNDNLGLLWDVFNTLNAFNVKQGYDFYYDEEDGYMDDYLQGDLPEEGRVAPAVIKFIGIGTGEKVTFLEYIKGYRDANGDLILEIIDRKVECNF